MTFEVWTCFGDFSGRNCNTLILSSWVIVIPNKPKLVSINFFGVFVENKLPIDVKEWEETEIIVTAHVS